MKGKPGKIFAHYGKELISLVYKKFFKSVIKKQALFTEKNEQKTGKVIYSTFDKYLSSFCMSKALFLE